MDKYTFIKAQLAKTNKKNDENYVITRIWNKLDNTDIKFITQQYVVREESGYALTDMYFPQLGLHVEVDEIHHKNNAISDKVREKDIISVTNHEVIRVDVDGDLREINYRIDKVVEHIKQRVDELGDRFVPWNIEKEKDPNTYIKKGTIELSDDVAFNRCVDACNCFGHNYKMLISGGAKHPYREETSIWFPKLFPNKDWDNSISADEKIIREKSIHPEKVKGHMYEHINSKVHNRIVFAKVIGPLGDIMYRFKGEYKLNVKKSEEEGCLIWERVATKVDTYPPKSKV